MQLTHFFIHIAPIKSPSYLFTTSPHNSDILRHLSQIVPYILPATAILEVRRPDTTTESKHFISSANPPKLGTPTNFLAGIDPEANHPPA